MCACRSSRDAFNLSDGCSNDCASSIEEGNNNMPKTLSGRIFKGSAAAALAIAASLAGTASGFAATRHHAPTYQDPPRYYNFVPVQGSSDYTTGQLGLRTNPTIVPPGAYGPPDPASCGGFHC
jgi:hypothetical protein